MVSTRFLRPPKLQPPPTSTLAPPKKACFSAPLRICETNPPPGAPLDVSMFHVSVTSRPNEPKSAIRNPRSEITPPDLSGTHPGPLFYAFLAPLPPQPQRQQLLPRAPRREQNARTSSACICAHLRFHPSSHLRNEPKTAHRYPPPSILDLLPSPAAHPLVNSR